MPKAGEFEILRLAANAEKGSEHPLAEAIIKAAKMKNIEIHDPESFEAVPDHGVKVGYKGDTILLGNRRLMEDYNIPFGDLEIKITKLEEEWKTVTMLAVTPLNPPPY